MISQDKESPREILEATILAHLAEEKAKKRAQKCCSDWTAKDKIQTSCVTVLIILLLVLVALIAYGLKVILSGRA